MSINILIYAKYRQNLRKKNSVIKSFFSYRPTASVLKDKFLSEVHGKPCQTSKMELFVKMVTSFRAKAINYSRKKLNLKCLTGF